MWNLYTEFLVNKIHWLDLLFKDFCLYLSESIKTICENYMQENMAEVVRLPSFTSLPQGLMLELIQKMTEKMKI